MPFKATYQPLDTELSAPSGHRSDAGDASQPNEPLPEYPPPNDDALGYDARSRLLTPGGPETEAIPHDETAGDAAAMQRLIRLSILFVHYMSVIVGFSLAALSLAGPSNAGTSTITMTMVPFVFTGVFELWWLGVSTCILHGVGTRTVFLGLGVVGLEAFATSLCALIIVAHMDSTFTCGRDRETEFDCEAAFRKAMAAACVRLILTFPICLGMSALAFSATRIPKWPGRPRGRIMRVAGFLLGEPDRH